MTAEPPEGLALPDALFRSTLMRRNGVMVVRGLLPPTVLGALQADFRAHEAEAKRAVWAGPNEAEWRGGEPARALSTVLPGPVEWGIFGSAAVRASVSDICGLEVEATGGGTYSYYCEPGDFLALHRDINRCDVAVITCLHEEGPPVARLRAYPASSGEPLSRVDRGRWLDIVLAPGDTAILAGGVVPHEVVPVAVGQRRAVAITCFRVRGAR